MPGIREERETIIIIQDNGEITVNSNSPSKVRQLTTRLGQPSITRGEFNQWTGTKRNISAVLPRFRRNVTVSTSSS